ncbi:hypothetical protein NBRC10513v2_003382 [Rhodotorula toruloides]|uniref:Proteophosphoglycan ppg4 n=1 Tax=Rhodotorula toruloides TaxID=5286 RepID=A0A0K3CIW5_RHOTO
MMRLTLIALAVASAVLAVPAPSTNAATTVVDAFRALRSNGATTDSGYAKRQSTNDVINGLQDLLEKAMDSQQSSSGKCHDECAGWFGLIEKCADHDSYYQVGLCACGSGPVDEMKTCGKCFGGSSSTDANNFGDYCEKTVASASSLGVTASTRDGFGGLSSATSRAGASASATSAVAGGSATQQTPASSTSNASSPVNTAGSTGAAGTIKLGAGAVVGTAAGAVALLAF